MTKPKPNSLRIRVADVRNFAVEQWAKCEAKNGEHYYEWTVRGWYTSILTAMRCAVVEYPRWSELKDPINAWVEARDAVISMGEGIELNLKEQLDRLEIMKEEMADRIVAVRKKIKKRHD